MISTLLHKIDTYRAARVRHTSPYWAAMVDLPPALYEYWTRTAQFEFKGIPRDALFFARAAEGLFNFFDCARHAGAPCALPSKAADSVWHAWARLAPASLEACCIKHFGRAIPHVEGAAMPGSMDTALATCLIQARKLELKPVGSLTVPRLFALDRKLGMPAGFAYQAGSDTLGFRHMDSLGKPKGELILVAAMAPAIMLEGGLISQYQYDDFMSRKRADSGGGCGSTSSSDGGCDGDGGGSSCGGGCGGGGD